MFNITFLIDKIKELLGLKKLEKEKEKRMSGYQNKNRLNYDDVTKAFPNGKGKKKDFSSLLKTLKELLSNLKKFSKEDKNFELNSDEFSSLKNKVQQSHNKEAKNIIELIEKEKEPTELELLSQQINNLTDKFDDFEKENLQSQEDIAEMVQSKKEIDKISKIINESFWTKLKQSIQIPKLDLSSITQKIESLKKDLQNNKNNTNDLSQLLSKKIDKIKFPAFPTPPKIPNDYLKKEDFEFTINDKLKDLQEIKESSENLETVPAKVNSIEKELKSLSEKMDNLPSSNGSQISTHIPKEEKSVIELAKYMRDGVAQFENIAKEYISKIGELEKLDKIKEEYQKELKQVKRDEFKNGEKAGKIELIKNLAENFPTEFKSIQSTFEDLLEEKFKKDEILEIDDKNINEMRSSIKDNIENGKYKILSSAMLLDNKILFKATVDKVDVEKADV